MEDNLRFKVQKDRDAIDQRLTLHAMGGLQKNPIKVSTVRIGGEVRVKVLWYAHAFDISVYYIRLLLHICRFYANCAKQKF